MILLFTSSSDVLPWLLQQTPVVIVMGIVIWYQAKDLAKVREKMDTRSEKMIESTTKLAGVLDRLLMDMGGLKDEIKEELKDMRRDFMQEVRDLRGEK